MTERSVSMDGRRFIGGKISDLYYRWCVLLQTVRVYLDVLIHSAH